jgi:predicted transcriptional regulator of viral defense system
MASKDWERVLTSLGGTATAGELVDAGLRWEDLYRLRDNGDLLELSRGIYRMASAAPTLYLDFIAVFRRVPHGTICLNSAASYWGLTDEIPSHVHVSVARGKRRPTIQYPPTKVHVFAAANFSLERRLERLESNDRVAMYSSERTVVDLMRLREHIGSDVALSALRRYLERPRARPGRVLELARELRAERAMSDALTTLLA